MDEYLCRDSETWEREIVALTASREKNQWINKEQS